MCILFLLAGYGFFDSGGHGLLGWVLDGGWCWYMYCKMYLCRRLRVNKRDVDSTIEEQPSSAKGELCRVLFISKYYI